MCAVIPMTVRQITTLTMQATTMPAVGCFDGDQDPGKYIGELDIWLKF